MSEEVPKHVPRIALLTCRHHDHIDHASEGRLMQALVRRGAAVTLAAWDDILMPLKRHDGEPVALLVDADVFVLRTTWDYWDRLDRFREFVRAMAESRLFNPPKTVLANLHKSYLHELELRGVGIVPTVFVEAGGEQAAAEEARARGWSVVVAKPGVGAAGSGLRKFDRVEDGLVEYLRELTAGGTALVQQFLPRVVAEGETSLVYFQGALSHAVTKMPAAGDFRSQVDFGGVYTLVEATADQRAAAERTLRAWEDAYAERPLYARVDLVPGMDGEPLLGELELVEPELFLDMHEDAAGQFAEAIIERALHARSASIEYRPDPWWRVAIFIAAYIVIACAVLVVFFAGVVAILVTVFGGP